MMKQMKLLLSVLLLLSLVLSVGIPSTAMALPGFPDLPELPGLPDLSWSPEEVEDLPTIPVPPTVTPKPELKLPGPGNLPAFPLATPTPTPKLKLPFDPNLPEFPIVTPTPELKLPFDPDLPKFPIATPTPELKLPFDPDLPKFPIATPTPELKLPFDPDLPKFPIATPTVSIIPNEPLTPPPAPTDLPFPLPGPEPTDKPGKASGGHTMNSEGPPFLVFRDDLTDRPWMFTPMDLSKNGEYRFPLIGDANQVVGEAKVIVQSGVAVVSYLVENGVSVDAKNEFFTFFPDIRTIPSLKPAELQSVRLKFGMPYPVVSWLGGDSKVLLYVNCPVSYDTGLAVLAPFSFQDPAYLARLADLLSLMD